MVPNDEVISFFKPNTPNVEGAGKEVVKFSG